MPTYTKQQLEAQYEKLPDALKDAIFSPEIAEKMFAIGKKHGLTMEKTGFAAEETGFVILGLLPPRDFTAALSQRLSIDRDKAQAIASDINHQVFFPLREALKETHHIEVGEAALHGEEVLPRRPVAPTSIKNQEVRIKGEAPAAPTISIINQESRIMGKTTAGPIKPGSLKTTPASFPSAIEAKPPAGGLASIAAKPAETKKPPPIILRPKFTDDLLQKEIAPLIGDMSVPVSPLFATREQTEKLVAEKLATQTSIKNQESRIMGTAPAVPDSAKPPTPQQVSTTVHPPVSKTPDPIKLEPHALQAPPSPPPPQVPAPIKLEPLAGGAPVAPRPTTPPLLLGTVKVPALDLRTTGIKNREEGMKKEPVAPASPPPAPKRYEGFDPYKEPVE